MKRRRLNVKLLGAMLAGCCGVAVMAYFVHGYQVRRNAKILLQLATDHQEQGELRAAAGYLRRYVNLRRDDDEGYARWALLLANIAQRDDASRREILKALEILPAAVRREPENDLLRRRLVELLLRAGRMPQARDHIETLLPRQPRDAELPLLFARCQLAAGQVRQAADTLHEAIGYDAATGTYDPQQGAAAGHVETYVQLAALLSGELEQVEVADQVMDQLVAVNPGNVRALLERAMLHLRRQRIDKAREDIDKAAAQDADDPEVLLAAAELAMDEGEHTRAETLLARGVKLHPEDERMYRAAATLVWQASQDAGAALEHIQRGLDRIEKSQDLLAYKTHLQLLLGNLSGAQGSLQELRDAGQRPELIALFEAQLLIGQGQLAPAAAAMERLRPKLARWPEATLRLNIHLGRAYEQLGQPDRAVEAYRLALRSDSRSAEAESGLHRAQRAAGFADQENEGASVADLIARELQLPAAQQDWAQVAQVAREQIKKQKLSPSTTALIEAEILAAQGKRGAADERLRQAIAEGSQDHRLWLGRARLALQDGSQGAAGARAILAQAQEQLGDLVPLRLARGALLIDALPREQMVAQIDQLGHGAEHLSAKEKGRLYTGLAALYGRAGNRARAIAALKQAAAMLPHDLPARMSLLHLAYEGGDLDEVRAAGEAIHELVQSPADPSWQYAQALALVLQAKQSDQPPQREELLTQVAELVRKIEQARPQWNELYRLKANLHLLQGDTQGATDAFERSFELGPPHPLAVRKQVQLLSLAGRFQQAQQTLELLRGPDRRLIQPRLQAEIYLRSGDAEQALEVASRTIAENQDNYLHWLWYGHLLLRSGQTEQAAEAFRQATNRAPEMPQVWLAQIHYQARHADRAAAAATLARAEQAVPKKARDLLIAQGQHILGNTAAASAAYQQALAGNPHDLRTLRLAAAFYLQAAEAVPGGKGQGRALIERILAQSTSAALAPTARWARRQKARLLAEQGSYAALSEARGLVEENRAGGTLRLADKLLLAEILAPRPEAVSRREAIRQLLEVQQQQPLSVRAQLLLAGLLSQFDRFGESRAQMLDLLDRHPDHVIARSAYCRMLLGKDLTDQAERHLAHLERLAPDADQTREIKALWLAKRGEVDQATKLVLQRAGAPPSGSHISDPGPAAMQQKQVRTIALLREIGNPKAAEDAAKRFYADRPQGMLLVAELAAQQGETARAFELLNQAADQLPQVAVAATAIRILRDQPEEARAARLSQVESWLERAAEQPSHRTAAKLQLASLRELQGAFAAEEGLYRELLSGDVLEKNQRGLVLNNLAFNLALRKEKTGDAWQMINEAIALLGPTGALLDTRAMVSFAQGDFDRARSDLHLALADQAKPVRYFHLALIEHATGNPAAAQREFSQARRMGLTSEALSPLEQPHFNRLETELGSSRGA